MLMSDWGLLTIVNDAAAADKAPLRQIKVIPFRDKHKWHLCPKYNIGSQ